MLLKDVFFKLIDLPFRLRNLLRRRWKKLSLFSNSSYQSDSEVTFYELAVREIISRRRSFYRFRRFFDYREILEHVDYELGLAYLRKIQSISPIMLEQYSGFKANDVLGKPRTYQFPMVGRTSPTTLRYVSVAAEIERLFPNKDIKKVVEIGAGYGGQALILRKTLNFLSYSIFDLPNVQILIAKYLSAHEVDNVTFPDVHELDSLSSDLVISNYAFSELPRNLQEIYLNRILRYSKNGYLLMNSGRSNLTGRSIGKLSVQEITEAIPNVEILDEEPLTGPDNYLLIWKSPK